MSEKKPWRCRNCGAVLGWIITNPHHRLERAETGDIITQGIIKCSKCGATREFYFAQAAIETLWAKRKSC